MTLGWSAIRFLCFQYKNRLLLVRIPRAYYWSLSFLACQKRKPAMENTVTTKTAAALAGIHPNAIGQLKFAGLIQPSHPCKSRSEGDGWGIGQVLAAALMKNLRGRGGSAKASVGALVLASRTPDEFEADFRVGRRFLLLIGDGVVPNLLTREAVERNPFASAGETIGVPVLLVDVERCYRETAKAMASAVGTKGQPA